MSDVTFDDEPERRPVLIPYRPRNCFKGFHENTRRWAIVVAHRGAGKTIAAVNKLIKEASELTVRPNDEPGAYAYIGPWRGQAKSIAWEYLKRYSEPLWSAAPNEAELRVKLLNGSAITIYGSDNPESLRGLHHNGVVMDEYATQRESVWSTIVRPGLAQRKGFGIFIGTPKGRNAFWDLWKRTDRDTSWYRVIIRADTSGVLTQEEYDDLQEDQSPEEFDQEYLCAWEAAIVGAYYAEQIREADASGRICHIDIDTGVRVHTGWDLGRRDAMVVWFVQCVGRERRLVDYYEKNGADFEHFANMLWDKKREHGWLYGEHFLPHDVTAHMLDSKLSRIETLRGLGIDPTVVPAHNPMDGINAVRRMLARTWIDPNRCERGLDCLRNYRAEWDDKYRVFKAHALHDQFSHGADALRTFAAGYDDPKVGSHEQGSLRRRRGQGGGQVSSWGA